MVVADAAAMATVDHVASRVGVGVHDPPRFIDACPWANPSTKVIAPKNSCGPLLPNSL